MVYEKHKIGVPFKGKFKEIFNSDSPAFGGKGNVNPRVKTSKKEECDDQQNSIEIKVPPMGMAVFSCTRVNEPVSANEKAKTGQQKKVRAKKSKGAAKKAVPKKSLREELAQKIADEEK